LKQLVRTAPRRISSLETATENESRFFRKRIVYGEKGVRPIALYVGTHVESHRPEEYLLVAWHDTYRAFQALSRR